MKRWIAAEVFLRVLVAATLLAAVADGCGLVETCTPYEPRCKGDQPQRCTAAHVWADDGPACEPLGANCSVEPGGDAVCVRGDL